MKFYRQYRNYSGNNIAILQKFNDDFDNGKNRNVITLPVEILYTPLVRDFCKRGLSNKRNDTISAIENFPIEDYIIMLKALHRASFIIRHELATSNASALLKMLNVNYNNDFFEKYLDNINNSSVIRFIVTEQWNEIFIPCLAVLYAVLIYYNMTLRKGQANDESELIDLLLSKDDKPDNIFGQIHDLFDYVNFCMRRFGFGDIQMKPSDVDALLIQDDFKLDGTIIIPWNYVTFRSKYFLIEHPKMFSYGNSKTAFRYNCEQSSMSFNYIKNAFKKKLPPIMAECKFGIITAVHNIGDISTCVTALNTGILPPKVNILAKKRKTSPNQLTQDEYKSKIKEYKSVYLDYLSNNLYNDSVTYFCKECRVNTSNIVSYEDAFLFRLSCTTILYENVLENRSSVVFNIDPERYSDCVVAINDYFSSDSITNKREKIASEMTTFLESGIKSYTRLYHTCFEEWAFELNCILK